MFFVSQTTFYIPTVFRIPWKFFCVTWPLLKYSVRNSTSKYSMKKILVQKIDLICPILLQKALTPFVSRIFCTLRNFVELADLKEARRWRWGGRTFQACGIASKNAMNWEIKCFVWETTRRPVVTVESVWGLIKCKKPRKVGRDQAVNVYECPSEDFIFDPRSYGEPLEFIQERGDMVRFVL